MRRDRGFSLVEATIAMTISTVLVLAVGSVFIAQSRFYERLNGGATIQDAARTAAQEIQNAVSGMVPGGLLEADSLTFSIRRPQTLAVVCAMQGANAHSLLTAGIDAVDDDVADGMGKLNTATGAWTFAAGSTSSVTGPTGGTPAARCFTNGTDTVGARNDFMRLNGLAGWFGAVTPVVGDVYMFYEEVEYAFAPSTLTGSVWGLFRGEKDGTLAEFVSSMDSLAYFEYRVAGSWRTSVTSGSLASVDAIRVHSAARARASAAGEDATFEVVVDVPFRNAP